MNGEPTDEDKRKKSVKMGPAELRPEQEKGHYGLYRPVYIDGWDDAKGEFVRVGGESFGPLAVFRVARQGEKVDMRTIDPKTQKELKLHCVFDPSHTFLRGREQ